MKAAIDELAAANTTDADRLAAMLRLRDLVRPIDNANGARSMPSLPVEDLPCAQNRLTIRQYVHLM